jgi:hypothetical protein
VSCCCEKLVAEARGQFEKPEEGERLRFEAVTRKQAKVLVRVVVSCRVYELATAL